MAPSDMLFFLDNKITDLVNQNVYIGEIYESRGPEVSMKNILVKRKNIVLLGHTVVHKWAEE